MNGHVKLMGAWLFFKYYSTCLVFREYEETLDALQADIETLEGEKGDIKERLKVLSRKSLMDNISRQSSQSGIRELFMDLEGVVLACFLCNIWSEEFQLSLQLVKVCTC